MRCQRHRSAEQQGSQENDEERVFDTNHGTPGNGGRQGGSAAKQRSQHQQRQECRQVGSGKSLQEAHVCTNVRDQAARP